MTEEQEDQVHEYAMRILEEIGVDVLHEEARELLADAGQTVEGDRVCMDRGWVMEQVAKAPQTFTLHARNAANTVEVGGGTPLWMGVGGPPFLSDLDEGRRGGTLEGHDTIIKLTQAASPLNCAQTGACEPVKMDVNTRHLDMEYSTLRWCDLPYTTYGTSGPKARDGIEMARIVHGGDLADRTALMGVVNPVSPLIWDYRMVDALIAWAESNQATVVTPFLLGGATAAVSVAGGLAQQVAEALSGVALAQTVRPGAPCLYGSFFQATDMRTGAPALGTPESIFGVFAGAQLARRYGLPFRGAAGSVRPTRSMRRPPRSRRSCCGRPSLRAPTSCCTRPAGSRAAHRLAREVRARRRAAGAVRRAAGGHRLQRGRVRLRGTQGGRARRPLARGGAHDEPLPRVAVHLAAVHHAGLHDVVGRRGRGGRGARQPPVEAAARVLRGSRHRPGVDAELIAFMDRRKAEPPPEEEH